MLSGANSGANVTSHRLRRARQTRSKIEGRWLVNVIGIIVAFVRSVHLKRAMNAVEANPHLNFWRVIYGNLLDVAVIDWCKLFGSDHEEHQPIHWKNVVAEDKHDEFRAGLYAAVDVTPEEWSTYWEGMKEYRDKQAAHFDRTYSDPKNERRYLEFDLALEAAFYYYDWILKDMRGRGIQHGYPEDIRDYCRRFFEQAQAVATKAINATIDLKEIVR